MTSFEIFQPNDNLQDREKPNLTRIIQYHLATNFTLAALYQRYCAIVDDPENELPYICEMRHLFIIELGPSAPYELDISKREWIKFGRICHNELTRQGRNRRQNATTVDRASVAELALCRNIVSRMLTSYVEYLEATRGVRSDADELTTRLTSV